MAFSLGMSCLSQRTGPSSPARTYGVIGALKLVSFQGMRQCNAIDLVQSSAAHGNGLQVYHPLPMLGKMATTF